MIKVAAYCRVSTEKEDQLNSFESQKRFFGEYIANQKDWQLCEIYADEGITGTSTKKRAAFRRMINDAHSGNIDLIITREVSRFSRNILDTITYTRQLKTLGVGVIFMSDGLNTLDPDAELRLSIMGSIAQEESRRTSQRVKWGQSRQMERGVVFGNAPLGYSMKDGILCIDDSEAETVRQIFYKYGIEKKSASAIAKELQSSHIRTKRNSTVWSSATILKILRNEKYVGDLVQKKTITTDYLTHMRKNNQGEEELIKIKHHHAPIIDRKLWETVQTEIKRRNRKAKRGSSDKYVFSGKIRCKECSSAYIPRIKTSKDGKRYMLWACSNAVRYGTRKKDSYGNACGCNVGWQLRDELAIEMLKCVVRSLQIDSESITSHIRTCLNDNNVEAEKFKEKIKSITHKKTAATDALLSGLITQDEYCVIKEQYENQLLNLNNRLTTALDKNTTDITVKISEHVAQLLKSQECSGVFIKTLTEYISVNKEGIAEIKLNHLSAVWRFKLQKH